MQKINKKRGISTQAKENIFAYCMLAPDIIGLAIFIFLPIIIAFHVSLHDWNALQPMKFIGLLNYKKLLGDEQWWRSLLNTITYTLMFVPLLFSVSLLLDTVHKGMLK